MNKFNKGDMLVVLKSSNKNTVGKVGKVIDITDGDYYTLDTLPNTAFKENCVGKARGIDLIAEERRRQIEVEGYDAEYDSHDSPHNLMAAAISYALYDTDPDEAKKLWPWEAKYFKPKSRLRNYVRSGALMAAALDLIQNLEKSVINKEYVNIWIG
jgi:hypothetical protein